MRIIKMNCKYPNIIGRVGENEAVQAQFDVSNIISEFGLGTFTVLYKLPGWVQACPVSSVFDAENELVKWDILDSYLAIEGIGECELVLMIDDVIVESIVYKVRILNSLNTETDPPKPWESWVDEVLQAKEDVDTAIERIDVDYTETNEKIDNHINNKNNPHEVTKDQVGLGDVDNTSDEDKPISTATQLALNDKVPTKIGAALILYDENGQSIPYLIKAKSDEISDKEIIKVEHNGDYGFDLHLGEHLGQGSGITGVFIYGSTPDDYNGVGMSGESLRYIKDPRSLMGEPFNYNSLDIVPKKYIDELTQATGYSHNGIYRGKNFSTDGFVINSQETLEQFLNEHEVSSGKFTDLYLGDEITIYIPTGSGMSGANKKFAVAGFDIDYNKGPGPFRITDHHIVLVSKNLYDNTFGDDSLVGYSGTSISTWLDNISLSLEENYGFTSHLIRRRLYEAQSINNTGYSMAGSELIGYEYNPGYSYHKLIIPSEIQVFGTNIWSSSAFGRMCGDTKLPIFNFINPYDFWYTEETTTQGMWLKDFAGYTPSNHPAQSAMFVNGYTQFLGRVGNARTNVLMWLK